MNKDTSHQPGLFSGGGPFILETKSDIGFFPHHLEDIFIIISYIILFLALPNSFYFPFFASAYGHHPFLRPKSLC